ncbi:MAG: hypothetical protein ACPGWR_27745 [Ardenticatenaceae bacterium]
MICSGFGHVCHLVYKVSACLARIVKALGCRIASALDCRSGWASVRGRGTFGRWFIIAGEAGKSFQELVVSAKR